jgi:phosphopantothenoylcysteine decarboxylase / phosphopantothenate---cysteine ligase
MWSHPATQRNLALLAADGVDCIGPNGGEMAESGEAGIGRMAEPAELLAAIMARLATGDTGTLPLSGRHVLVTAGPTHEAIDPVRYIANRSSGKQGYAIARAAAVLGARVTLISGPVALAAPAGVDIVAVESAAEMLTATEAALPADIAIFAAAVADWRVANAAGEKIKKGAKAALPKLDLTENADILKTVAHLAPGRRPPLVIGFAAETENVLEHAKKKRKAKGCDWIVANDVSPKTGVMGGNRNTVHIVTADGVEDWPEMDKDKVADALVARAAERLAAVTVET